MWAKLAEQSDKEGWSAARVLAAFAEHEMADGDLLRCRGERPSELHWRDDGRSVVRRNLLFS